MIKIARFGLVSSLIFGATALVAEDNKVKVVDDYTEMFSEAKSSGKIKTVYAKNNYQELDSTDTFATALGGSLKYELAKYKGFNAGFAFTTSNDIDFATGDDEKQNDELSSGNGSYTQLSEAFLNYSYSDIDIRVGRQILDTPLADSDDIRMIPNTFEAVVATYKLSGVEFMAGNIQRWQGVDAGLDDGWQKTGEDTTWFGGISYEDELEFNLWVYNVSKLTTASYVDAGYNYEIDADVKLRVAMQYLNEQEISDSGVKADIYGVLAELEVYGLGLSIAANSSKKYDAKESFSGFGGGTIFTNMDTMIINEITVDRDATAIVGGISYEYGDYVLSYVYGDFKGKADSAGDKAHIVEQNICFEYSLDDKFELSVVYVTEEDKESEAKTQNDWNRTQFMMAYNF